MVRSVRYGSNLRTSAPSPMDALRASSTSTACTIPGFRLMASGAVIGDCVDVPLGRLESL